VAQLMDALDAIVRRERARVVGALYRVCGTLDAAEEAFHEALMSALTLWPKQGTPDNPAAWLTTVGKNHALQVRRHERVTDAKAGLLQEDPMIEPNTVEAVSDDQLRLVFTCCHPALPQESQVALTLKVVAGFTTEELARAFLCPEPTMAQRIVRAKRTIDEKRLSYETPRLSDLSQRLAAALTVVYLVFNEGHTAREGALMRLELQAEALRLGGLLCELLPTEPDVFGLYALMAFSAARAATRTDGQGALLLLSEQDRSRWDRALILEGLVALQRAVALGGGGLYLAQAELAACHATAPTWEATDWRRILRCYDRLMALAATPVVAMHRAVAVMMVHGPKAGLEVLAPLEGALQRYHLFFATRADLVRQSGGDPKPDYQRALALVTNDSERRFLERRLAELLPTPS
jgi:RNA polymerase sigma-70 factor (ECF subfamily)